MYKIVISLVEISAVNWMLNDSKSHKPDKACSHNFYLCKIIINMKIREKLFTQTYKVKRYIVKYFLLSVSKIKISHKSRC